MKTIYQKQFAMMATVVLVAFLLLGGAFAALSYQYIAQDKQESMERNANYVASFTSSYLTNGFGSSMEDQGYQMYIASQADVSGATILLCINDGEVVYVSSGENILLGRYLPAECVQAVERDGSYSARSSLGGLFPEKSFASLPVWVFRRREIC